MATPITDFNPVAAAFIEGVAADWEVPVSRLTGKNAPSILLKEDLQDVKDYHQKIHDGICFDLWWNAIGSAITPDKAHDIEEHAEVVAKAAYIQGQLDALDTGKIWIPDYD